MPVEELSLDGGSRKISARSLMITIGLGVGIWAIVTSRSRAAKAEKKLEYRNQLMAVREEFWSVGPDCEITYTGPGADAGDSYGLQAAMITEAMESWKTDFKKNYIAPAIDEAVLKRRILNPGGVTKFLLDEMFPECEWPPQGNLIPECTWETGSLVPVCTWNASDILSMRGLVWTLFYGMVMDTCAEGSESGWRCVEDSQTGNIMLMPATGD
jgi:hypothetical protein